ncbi:ATP-dependent Lon protease pim1, partial [Coemansia sp. S17]
MSQLSVTFGPARGRLARGATALSLAYKSCGRRYSSVAAVVDLPQHRLLSLRQTRQSLFTSAISPTQHTANGRWHSQQIAALSSLNVASKRTFQTSASARKERDGKSDDNDDPDSSATKKEQEEDEQEADDKDDSKSASRRRRAPRRSESEKPAAAAGANGGEQAQADPLTQLKRAVGVADYAQGQQSFIPDNYPNVMMLPITRRPLFPSLYKSIQVQDPQVIGALKELVERGEPYLATFMLKNDERDVDSIGDMDEVHEIGVFSRIMSIYVSPNPEDKHLTVALYPWRRVRMKRILGIEKDPESTAAAPALDQQELIVSESTEDSAVEEVVSPVANAANVLKAIKLDYNFTALEVENVEDEPYDAKDPTISATMSEIVSVLREITTMNP